MEQNQFSGAKAFLYIPAAAAHDPALLKKPKSILLLGEICSMLNIKGKFFMSNKTLANKLNCTRRSVIDYLNLLEDQGYIKRQNVIKDGTMVGRTIQSGPTLVKSISQGWCNTLHTPSEVRFTPLVKHTSPKENSIREHNKRTEEGYIGQVEPDHHLQQRKQVIDYLNSKLGTSYRANASKNKRLIDARLREGYQLQDFKKVIDHKYTDWHDDQQMSKYLRPETLFGTKFEGYLNEKQTASVLLTSEERDGHFG